ADPWILWRHLGAHTATGRAARDDDRALDREQQIFFGRRELGHLPGALEIAHHHREGLLVTVLSLAEPRDREPRTGVAGEMEAAETLDRDDQAGLESARRGAQGIDGAELASLDVRQPQARPALRA